MKVINNDDLLDQWVEKKSKEMENRAKKEHSGSKVAKGALNYEEVIIFDDADDEYYDELEAQDGLSNSYQFEGVDYEG